MIDWGDDEIVIDLLDNVIDVELIATFDEPLVADEGVVIKEFRFENYNIPGDTTYACWQWELPGNRYIIIVIVIIFVLFF